MLVISKDKNKATEHAHKLCLEHNISKFDITIIEQEKSIGIEIVRLIQKNLFLSPVKGKTKAIILKDAHTITIEAQNALLKILEEPPQHALIILLANNPEAFLPTVLSRLVCITLKEEQRILTQDECLDMQTFTHSLVQLPIGQRLKLAQDHGKSKEETLLFLEKMLFATRAQVIQDVTNEKTPNPSILKELQKTYTIVKTINVSPRFALEQFVLNI